ncbi:MAG: DUF6263 family protein [Planctomycetota bacterium]
MPLSLRPVMVFVLVCATGWAVPAVAQLDLKFNLRPGHRVTQTMEINQTIAQQMMGMDINMQQLIGMTTTGVVGDRASDAGGVWLDVTYDHVRFKQDGGPMGAVDYDSANPPADVPLAARGFSALIGRTLSIEYDAVGDVVQIEGVDKALDAMIESMDLPAGPARDGAVAMIKSQFNEDIVKQMVAINLGMYPGRLVDRGDQWDDQQQIGGMTPMKFDYRYTLEDYDEAQATLKLDGKISPHLDAPPFNMNGAEFDAEMKGTQAGTIMVNLATGWPKSIDMTQDIDGGITVHTPDGGAMDIEMKIVGTVKVATDER